MSGCKGLFTSWTMKSSQGPIKTVIGCWARPMITSVYTKGNMLEWPWSSRSSIDIFWGLHYPLTRSNGICGGRGKRGPMKEKCCYKSNFDELFLGEEKMEENGQSWLYCFKIVLLGHILQIQHICFMVHGHSSWSTFGLHLVRVQRLCKLIRKQIGPWKLDHHVGPRKRPSSMVWLHGPWCKPALSLLKLDMFWKFGVIPSSLWNCMAQMYWAS